MPRRTTIVLVDDHAMVRSGIRAFLGQQAGLEIVAEAEDGREAIVLAARHAPDVMLLDIGMPEMNGIEATRRIHAADPKIGIIALSMHSDARYVTGALDAGARGYLLKTSDPDDLLRAIAAVSKGRSYLTAAVTHVLVDRRGHARAATGHQESLPAPSVLTPKEREVLQLIAEGLTTKEIAGRLGVATKTAETHRTNLMRKLGLHSIAVLTKYAIRHGITTVED